MKKIFKKITNKLFKPKNLMVDSKLSINELKSIVQDCNVNFLVGSGLSVPYLKSLGKIESLLTELSQKKDQEQITKDQEAIIRASIYQYFFDNCISKNIDILNETNESNNEVLNDYNNFIKIINTIILNRRSSVLSKQINIFTTNFDIFLEKSLELANVEYNDGFNGLFNPVFNISNFKKSFLKRSLHYDNIYELPVFNLIKIHGSLTWKKEEGKEDIFFDKTLSLMKEIEKVKLPDNDIIKIKSLDRYPSIEKLSEATKNKQCSQNIGNFIKKYEKLSIINPTKEKFKETILNRNYYELLRIYSTELEKENTVLFIMGFSFSDEHIREVTIRTANSNPTLKIYIFAYDEESKKHIETEINKSKPNNENIQILSPQDLQNSDDFRKFNFSNINKNVFNKLLEKINR